MKKFLSFAVACAMCGVIAGCGDNGTNDDVLDDDGVIIIPDSVVADEGGTDTNDRDDFVGVDTNVPDNGIDTNVPPDEGIDTDLPDTNVNPDEGEVTCIDDPGSCQNYYSCQNECPTGTEQEACVAECQDALSTQGQADLQAFSSCLTTNGCNSVSTNEEFYACLQEFCTPEYYGCFHGCTYESCADLYGCFDGCPDDDTTTSDDENQLCISDCFANTTVAGLTQNDAFTACYVAECPICGTYETQAELDQCNECYSGVVWDECYDEFAACQESGTEYLTCEDFTVCFSGCDSTSSTYDACVDACQDGVALEALRDRIAAENCSMAACPVCETENMTEAQEEECNTCWSTSTTGACATEWALCLPNGDSTCIEIKDCIYGCTDSACAQTCYYDGTFAAQDLYAAFENCYYTLCKDETTDDAFDTCVTNAVAEGGECNDEWVACQGT